MESKINRDISPDFKLAGVCGVYCPSCTLYIGTKEEPGRLEFLAGRMGVKENDLKCDGCRSDRRSAHCRSCSFIRCAKEKGVDFCGNCNEFPCRELKEFQKEMPHRAGLWESHARIREAGYEVWFTESAEDNSCSSCGTMNSAYDPACRSCSAVPASNFIRKHGKRIREHLNR